MKRSKELCFIIGMGRSGTTLLSKLMNQHPQIHATPEAVFLLFFLDAYKNKTEFSEHNIELMFKQIKWFSYTHPWAGWTFDLEKAEAKTKEFVRGRDVSYHDLCKFIYEQFEVNGMDKSQAVMIADKNPSYTLFTDKLSHNFTRSKFIYIVRDYRANILSRKENPDLRSPEVSLNAWLWNFFNERALRFARNHPEKVHLLKYEDLVANNATELKKIFSFLDLDVNAPLSNTQYSRVNEADHTIPDGHEARFRKKYDDLNKPVNTDRTEAWRTGLTEKEILACDSICGELGKEFGYAVHGQTRSRSKYFGSYMRARKEILKERLIYTMHPKAKFERLKKVYTESGYN